MNYAVIFAGGTGSRMNTKTRPKQFLTLHGKEIIIYTLEHFENHPDIDGISVVCIEGWIDYLKKLLDKFGKNAGLIFVRLRPGIDIKGVIGPDGKRLESERLPEFPGGKTAMFNFIEKNKKFPFALLDKGIESGCAQVTCVVKSDCTL